MIAYVLLRVFLILLLVAANAFFAAAEFSLVSVRDTRIQQLIASRRIGARIVQSWSDPEMAQSAEAALSKIENVLPPHLARLLADRTLWAPSTTGRQVCYLSFGMFFERRVIKPPPFFFGSTFRNGSFPVFLLNQICCAIARRLKTK